MKKRHYLFLLVLFLHLPVTAQADTLVLQPTFEVEAGLQSGLLAKEYTFYYSGSQALPHTIIAVLKGVGFDQSLWQEVAPSEAVLTSWYEMIDNPHRAVQEQYFGGFIVNGAGQRVALWYSMHRYRNAELREDGVLHIARPFIKSNRPGSRRKGGGFR